MNWNEIQKLVSQGESHNLEFKKSTANLRSAAETLCGFLNGKGGVVIIGVSDAKKILGQFVTDSTRQEIAATLRKFEPTANIEVDYYPVSDKEVIVLTAYPDHHYLPYTFDGRAYERKESSTSLMSQSRYQQLLLSRKLTPILWEALPAIGVTIEDLDEKEINNTLKDIAVKKRLEANLEGSTIPEILKRLKLIADGRPTNAAVVLFAKEIENGYLQCVIRMARFRGNEKSTNLIDSRHVFGNAFQLLQEAENFILRNTAIASHLKKGEFIRTDTPEYPANAVREALINALCHRDYSSPAGSITLSIYDNRLEIANNGLLLQGITLGELKIAHTSHPRNPNITNVFFRRGLIEALGIGTQEIIHACKVANMREPDFYEQAGAFVVRLWSPTFLPKELSPRQKTILKLLESQPLSPQELLALLKGKVTDRTLRRDLQTLKEEGYISSHGQKGPQTLWHLNK